MIAPGWGLRPAQATHVRPRRSVPPVRAQATRGRRDGKLFRTRRGQAWSAEIDRLDLAPWRVCLSDEVERRTGGRREHERAGLRLNGADRAGRTEMRMAWVLGTRAPLRAPRSSSRTKAAALGLPSCCLSRPKGGQKTPARAGVTCSRGSVFGGGSRSHCAVVSQAKRHWRIALSNRMSWAWTVGQRTGAVPEKSAGGLERRGRRRRGFASFSARASRHLAIQA